MLLSILKTACSPGVPFRVVPVVLNSHGGTEAAWSLPTSCTVYSLISPTWLALQAGLERNLSGHLPCCLPSPTAMELLQLFFKLFSDHPQLTKLILPLEPIILTPLNGPGAWYACFLEFYLTRWNFGQDILILILISR